MAWVEPLSRDQEGRLLLGREALILQGFPVEVFLQKVRENLEPTETMPSESLMMDLAGNAMALPAILAMLQAGFCALDWRPGVRSGVGFAPAAEDGQG